MSLMIMSDEEWRSMEPLGYPSYAVSTHGNIKNIKSIAPLKQASRNGYMFVSLRDINRKCRTLLIHRMVALTFLDPPETINQNTVDHINRDKGDNHVINLRWASMSEQNQNRKKNEKKFRSIIQYTKDGTFVKKWLSVKEIKEANPSFSSVRHIYLCCRNHDTKKQSMSAYGYKWSFDKIDLDGEEWKLLRLPHLSDVYVSSQGRVKSSIDGVPTYGTIDGDYYRISIRDKNTHVQKKNFVHRLVAMAFLEQRDDASYVNHKNGTKEDNSVSNLEWVTASENSLHAVATGLRDVRDRFKGVLKISSESNEIIAFYPNVYTAATAHKLASGTSISRACRQASPRWGYLWVYADDVSYVDKLALFNHDQHTEQPNLSMKRTYREVVRVDQYTEQFVSYPNVSQACKSNDMTTRTLLSIACERVSLYNGFYWLYNT